MTTYCTQGSVEQSRITSLAWIIACIRDLFLITCVPMVCSSRRGPLVSINSKNVITKFILLSVVNHVFTIAELV